MRNATFKNARPRMARELGFCETDPRVLSFTNDSQETILNREIDPVGSIVQYRFCTTNNCLVLPRQIQTVLGFTICNEPGVVRPIWYSFHANGPGQVCATDCCGVVPRMIDQGTVVAFNEVRGTGKYIRVYAQNAVDAGKTIILKYYREDTHAKQYSSIDGVVQEGEELTLVAPPAYAVTSTTVMPRGLYGVIREATQYPVDLFEYDGVSNTQNLAMYEPSETNPIYRKLYLPGASERGGCADLCGEDDDDDEEAACEQTTVTVLSRLQHVPVVTENDPLVIGNIPALAYMAVSIQSRQQRRLSDAMDFEAACMRELKGELDAFHGAGQTIGIQVQNRATFGVGGSNFWYGYGGYLG